MSEPTKLNERVTRLEAEMTTIRDIAATANREVSFVPAVLHGHTKVLNSLRRTQREHSEQLKCLTEVVADHGKRLERLERKVDEGFARVDERFAQIDKRFAQIDERFARVDEKFAQIDENFAAVQAQFKLMGAGIVRITELLTIALDLPDG